MATENAPLVTFNQTENMTIGTVGAGTSFDADGARDFGQAIGGYLKNNPGARLLINFQNITYLASAALTELLRISDIAKETKGADQLCGLSKDIHKVFEITQLNQVFKIDPDEDVEKTILRLDNTSEWEVYDS